MMMKKVILSAWIFLLALLTSLSFAAPPETRGVGIYPGDPNEDYAPLIIPDTSTYRNLALHRPAYHSSSYDYNLTAQLVTDGIIDTTLPRWMATIDCQNGAANKIEREFLLDGNIMSSKDLGGPKAWVQFEFAGGGAPFELDRLKIEARIRSEKTAKGFGASVDPQSKTPPKPEFVKGDWICEVKGSDDGKTWKELGRARGTIPPPPNPPAESPFPGFLAWFYSRGTDLKLEVPLELTAKSRFYRVMLESNGGGLWTLSEVDFGYKNQDVKVAGPHHFTSAWMPEGKGDEWVYVDLGASCTIDRVTLYWIRKPAKGILQVSDDAVQWNDIRPLPMGRRLVDHLALSQPIQGRYIRVFLNRPATLGDTVLSELEVYGRGGSRAVAESMPEVRSDGRQDLSGGAWKLQRASLVNADGEALSQTGFDDTGWIIATVPATVLSSYYNIGALPDPNFGSNHLMISDSFFCSDFWYRTEFVSPPVLPGRKIWLNFDGINWKAEVFLNGEKLGRIKGAFMRGLFDVNKTIRPGEKNALAVRIEATANPGSTKQKTLETAGLNGGALGGDNPTYHASVGWDWIPPVRGRNIGIWNDVCLTQSGGVTIKDPFVKTTLPLPDTSKADVFMEVPLENHTSSPVSGALRGRFGDITFEQQLSLEPKTMRTVTFNPSTHPQLRLQNPKLWWPAGYGEPNLYHVELEFLINGKTSDYVSFLSGVRQFTYNEDGGALRIYINDRRFIGRGGNWGFPEVNLRYRKREYDTAVRYHRDMNFNFIRNWVGQTGDEEFYEACDKYGIVIWQDFWLANPVDGPDPFDNEMFLSNVKDYVLRVRNHPSLGIYVGRNEGNPPKMLDDGIRQILSEIQPEIHYISNSAWGVVSGGGPYSAQRPKTYFQNRATPKLHSEVGMPNILTIDSLRLTMPESSQWPRGLDWGLHDFNLHSNVRISGLVKMMDEDYGGAENAMNAADWVTLAQFINYDGYRAMFEAQSKNRMGILLWMSHPAWPSFVWQTYDYFFEPTAGYFGSKKGAEPLHIQWNSATDNIEVVNYHAGDISGLNAQVEVLNMDGSVQWTKSAPVDSPEDSVNVPFKMEYPAGLSPVHFIRLKLTLGGESLSENFYWRGLEEGNFKAIHTIPKVRVDASTSIKQQDGRWILNTELQNNSKHPALMIRLKAVRSRSGDRILPVFYSDNYVSLMPGESRSIRTELENADTRGETPRIIVEGFNIKPEEGPL
jgi:hypothetical protein